VRVTIKNIEEAPTTTTTTSRLPFVFSAFFFFLSVADKSHSQIGSFFSVLLAILSRAETITPNNTHRPSNEINQDTVLP
jgi:uncharacterized membrane protein